MGVAVLGDRSKLIFARSTCEDDAICRWVRLIACEGVSAALLRATEAVKNHEQAIVPLARAEGGREGGPGQIIGVP
jgi:hypothetical protein